jgi:hypothetical protein
MFTVPAPDSVISHATPDGVMFPEQLKVPVETVMMSRRAPLETVVDGIVIEAQETDPAPIAMVRLNPLLGLRMVMAPLTVSVFVPLIVSVVFAEIVVAHASEVQTAAVSTVTLTPLLMVTVSPATGTALPPQVAVLLQLPETLAVRAAP